MEIHRVSDGFAVAGQIQPADLPVLADKGFTTIICNRPDAEEDGQPDITQMREEAQCCGMAFHHIPVSGGEFPAPSVAAFRAVRRGSEGPILAFCRTGTRSITLETLANPDNIEPAQRLSRAANAGYDLSSLSPALT